MLDFIREKIDETVQQNPEVRALNVYLKGKLHTYIISYDSLKHTVTGVVLQQGHKRKPISLSDILLK